MTISRADVAIDEAVKAERETCAVLVDQLRDRLEFQAESAYTQHRNDCLHAEIRMAKRVAKAIRART